MDLKNASVDSSASNLHDTLASPADDGQPRELSMQELALVCGGRDSAALRYPPQKTVEAVQSERWTRVEVS